MMDNDQCELELDVPLFIELKQSSNVNNDYGAYCTKKLSANQFIGHFKGKIRKATTHCGDNSYVWTIFSSRQLPLFYIDGSDPKDSNWLRFVRSTNDASKKNVICMQQNQQISYFTSKEIKIGDELLTYLPQEKKKKAKKSKNEKQDEPIKTNKKLKIDNETSLPLIPAVKTWTCQLCKKQFEQRMDLSKHHCVEHNLKLLKKKKDIRKKRWREAHWKRKIDLSYIETTSLTQLCNNIADNLSFCIDGTNEDLKAYSKEVKDYLNTDLGAETQIQMFLKCCFPDVYSKLGAEPSALLNIDVNLIGKSNSYFIDCIYMPTKNNEPLSSKSAFSRSSTNSFNCKNCKSNYESISDLINHQRDDHKLIFTTTFDCYNIISNDLKISNSPIGYSSCDPFAYVLNLHWDQTLEKKCDYCNLAITRPKFLKHITKCWNKSQDIETPRKLLTEDIKTNKIEMVDSNDSICSQILNNIITLIENEALVNCNLDEDVVHHLSDAESSVHSTDEEIKLVNNNPIRISPRLRRYSQRKIKNSYLIDKILYSQSDNSLDDNNDKSSNKTLSYSSNRRHSDSSLTFFTCDKCALEFTSSNSVLRHQEKSCLRVKVINLKTEATIDNKVKIINRKKCPICSAIFNNTHRLSVHIYKHHGNLLGSSNLPPVNLNEIKKVESNEDEDDIDVEVDYFDE